MPKKSEKELKAIERRVDHILKTDGLPADYIGSMHKGEIKFRDLPLKKRELKMKALGFATSVNALKQLYRSLGMPAGEAEKRIARRLNLEVGTLRQRMQRAK